MVFQIGHDGTAPGSGWFVKEVEVDLPTKGKHYTFMCKQWLARDKGDAKTSRIFSVDDGISSMTSYRPSKFHLILNRTKNNRKTLCNFCVILF